MDLHTRLEKEARIIRREIDRFGSISRKKDLSYDSLEIESLLAMIDRRNVYSEDSLLDYYDYVYKYEEGIKNYYLNDLQSKIDYYYKLSCNILDRFDKSNFNVYNNAIYSKISEKEMIDLISTFLNDYDERFYKHFINMYKDGQILLDDYELEKYGLEGKCFFINHLKKSYIISSSKEMDLHSIALLVHELGHSYEFKLLTDKNFETREGIYSTNLTEVSSTFFEVMFYNYLLENNYNVEQTKDLINDYLVLLLEQFYQVLMVILSKKYINDEFFITIDDDEIKSIIDDIWDKHGISFDINKNEFNINTCLSFGYGMIISLFLYELYKDNKNEVKKSFENILMTYGLSRDNNIYSKLGISNRKILNCGALKRTIELAKK